MHMDILADQLGLSVVGVWLVQQLKNRMGTKNVFLVNRIFAALIAAISTAGIHYAYEASAGSLTITGLTGGSLLHFAWEMLKQVAFQEGIFRAAVKEVK